MGLLKSQELRAGASKRPRQARIREARVRLLKVLTESARQMERSSLLGEPLMLQHGNRKSN